MPQLSRPETPLRPDLVLVADDCVGDRIYLSHILARQGASVRLAGDGEEAVRLARDMAFDLILMDVTMPRLSGMEAVRQIREIERGCTRTPAFIQMTTAHGEMEDMAWSAAAGADGHMVKPFSVKQVLWALNEARAQRHAPAGA